MISEGYTITHRHEGAGVVRICPAGDFDVENQAELARALLGAVRDPGVAVVVVDLGAATFVGSGVLNAMIVAYNVGLSLNKPVRVINARSAARKVFDATGLSDLLIAE